MSVFEYIEIILYPIHNIIFDYLLNPFFKTFKQTKDIFKNNCDGNCTHKNLFCKYSFGGDCNVWQEEIFKPLGLIQVTPLLFVWFQQRRKRKIHIYCYLDLNYFLSQTFFGNPIPNKNFLRKGYILIQQLRKPTLLELIKFKPNQKNKNIMIWENSHFGILISYTDFLVMQHAYFFFLYLLPKMFSNFKITNFHNYHSIFPLEICQIWQTK